MSREQYRADNDKIIFRVPNGMRENIKAAAAANNRSMNAEIVARLETNSKTLRDEFAMAALAAWPVTDREGTFADLAAKCYALADVMLNERDIPR